LLYDNDEQYTLTIAFPNTPIYTHQNNRNTTQVAVCNGYKNNNTRHYPPILTDIPLEIQNVLMFHRRYLSPVHMSCSLGRTAGTNHYTHYRHLEGLINISHNYRTLEVYSGTAGAYLNTNEPPNWFHETLIPASNWLKQHNELIKKYASNINITHPSPENPVPVLLPLARQSINTQESFSNIYRSNLPDKTSRPSDLVVPNDSFPLEIHNEDSHYNRLVAGSINNTNLPILFNNPDLEALIFPDLFSNSNSYYENIRQLLNFQPSLESYGKYIKLRML
ncbi:10195_t:CDS:1, partial [Ambispora leptoticha]